MIKANLLLCDSAQAYDGKLSVLGGGWSWIKLEVPFGIGIIVEVPWDRANTRLPARLSLLDQDGNPVAPDGTNPLVINLDLEVGRPVGQLPGSSQRIPLAFNFPPVLTSAGRYSFEFLVDDYSISESFTVISN